MARYASVPGGRLSLPFEVWASPEPTFARIDARTFRDQLAETGHEVRDGDIALLASLGITATRYPVLWEKSAPGDPAHPDLAWARRRLDMLRERGIEPVVTLLHHGSGPPHTSLVDPDFPEKFAAYAGAVAAAFPWVRRWTPINEPLTTARFSTLYGHWYPNGRRDHVAFGHAIVNQARAIQLGMQAIRRTIADAQCVLTEDLQAFTALDAGVGQYVAHKRERAFLSAELLLGRVVQGHALYDYLRERCNVSAATLAAVAGHDALPDLLGWNYYPYSERALRTLPDGSFGNEAAHLYGDISPYPLLAAAWERLGVPFGLSEVHAGGNEAQRVAWLTARADDLARLASRGFPVRMLGAWAAFGLVDWNSLLTQRSGHREDGIFTCASGAEAPQETAVAQTLRALARGAHRAEVARPEAPAQR